MTGINVFSDNLAAKLRQMKTEDISRMIDDARLDETQLGYVKKTAFELGHEAIIWRAYGLKDNDDIRYGRMLTLLAAMHDYPDRFPSFREKASDNY